MKSIFLLNETQKDRLLAGAAYASLPAGFTFIAPLAIYLWKRKESPFIAFHALQAIFLWIAIVLLFLYGFVVTMVVVGVLEALIGPEIPLAALIVGCVILLALGTGVSALVARTAAAAYRGERAELPIIGHIAVRILGKAAARLPPR